jgi:hypothetical protein
MGNEVICGAIVNVSARNFTWGSERLQRGQIIERTANVYFQPHNLESNRRRERQRVCT